MPRLAICCLVLVATGATASTSSEDRETLLGWSEDGRVWAVEAFTFDEEATTLNIMRGGKLVFHICNKAIDEDCERGKKNAAVSIEAKKGRSGIARINIERHKTLKKYKLKRVAGAWRKAFKKKYTLKNGPYGPNLSGEGRCAKGFRITKKNGKAKPLDAKKVKAKKGCLKAHGAYLHPNGKYALVKTTHSYLDDPDEGMSDTTNIAYQLVELTP